MHPRTMQVEVTLCEDNISVYSHNFLYLHKNWTTTWSNCLHNNDITKKLFLVKTRNLAITNKSRTASYLSFRLNDKKMIAHIWHPTAVINFVHYICSEIQTMKLYEHQRSLKVTCNVILHSMPTLSIRDQKIRLHLYSDKDSWNDLDSWSINISGYGTFNRPHITFFSISRP